MEPDVSMETGSMIRIAVLPIGGPIPHQRLREYVSMLSHHTRIDLSSISSFYLEHQKSPFTHQPWESGRLRFKYMIGGAPPSPWEDFQAHRKILAVIGLCHCPASPDLDLVIDQFASVSKGYGSALAKRLFAFSPSDEQLEEGREKENSIILFSPSDQQAQALHMLTMIQDLAATLLMEFEKWVLRAESTGTILKTPLDSQSNLSSEEVIKAKKRRLARAQKTIGDYCLLAASPVDANAHFVTAIELARLTGDVFWHAGALEGSVCALLVDRMDERDSLLEEEVKYRYYTVIQLYKRSYLQDNAQRVSTATFELEAQLKLARYLCRRLLVKEAVELLMNASDGAKSLIDANDCLILYVEIARLFGALGYQRKAAFFSRQIAQLYLKQDNTSAAISAMQVLSMASKVYRVQSRGTNLKQHGSAHERSSNAESGKIHPQSIISLFESQWSTLQMVVLREILMSSVRAGDPLAAWSAAARLLRSFYPLITPSGQSGLASSLANSADRLPSGTRCADPVLPFIRLHSFRIHPSQMEIIKRDPAKKDWWTDSAPSGPFIYTPFSKGGTTDSNKQELTWIVGEPVQVLVELANPCAFELMVESIYLSIHSGNFDAFPVSVNLPPNTAKVILLSGIPTKIGPVTIPGCIVHCFGVITEHLFRDVDNLLLGAAQGLVLSDPFRCCGSVKSKNVLVPSISVVPPLPLLVSYVVGGDCATILYEGEIHEIRIRLTNAGTVPIEQAHISLSGKNQNSVLSIAHEALNSALPLKPGAEVSLTVIIKAWKLSLADPDHDPGKNASGTMRGVSKEGSSPFLVIHYAGPMLHTDELYSSESYVSPGRRLVVPLHICVVQGLRFVKARLLSMEIPARVCETLPQPVSLDQNNAEEITVYSRIDSLVKIDPYRGSWELRLLELELSNPTDVVFDVNVSVQLDISMNDDNITAVDHGTAEFGCPKTRIDHDCSARVLIPLEHFKLPILDNSLFAKDRKNDAFISKSSSFTERNSKAELATSISNLVSKIKVRWQSGRNSSGELNIKDAVQAALQASVMDILLPDPLTFGFRLTNRRSRAEKIANVLNSHGDAIKLSSRRISTHEMIDIEVLVRNNTRELIRMSLSLTCRDVAGDNCIEGNNATVLWAGILSGISLEIPPLEELAHPFSLYFLVPGEYTLLAAAVIDDANDVLRGVRADEPFCCRGSPFRISVSGTV